MNRNQGKSLVGYRLDKYEIHAEIGRGGMGAVYKGYDPLLDRYLAVKVLAPHLVWEKEFVQRFLREARSAARLKHPNIVTIHDVGQQDGWYYFVMEYVEGIALNQFIKQHGALPVRDVLDVVGALASALDYAHSKDLIHRDIKPGNIIVGVGGEITLTDFGIARAAQEKRMTSTGTILGTPEYMAPEQAKGEEADARSDLYSLAMVAYQMLSGAVPYDADSTLALLYKVVNNPLPPIRQYQPDIPEAVEGVLQRALAKEPDARYSSVTAFYEALRTAFGELPQDSVSLVQNVRPEDVSVVATPPVEEVSSWSESDMRQSPTRIEGATPAPEQPVSPPPMTPPPPTTPPPMTPPPAPQPEIRSSETVIEEAEAEKIPQPTPAADERKRRVPVWVWGALGAIVLLGGVVGGGMATGLIGATPTPTETATPTLTATSTPAPTETNTPVATSTSAATPTDLLTPTPVQSPTPTEEPTDTPTPTPDLPTWTPAPTRTPAPQAVPPQLIAPASGQSTGGTVTFSWTGTLGQGQTYQVTAYTSGYTAQSEALTVNTWTASLPAEHFGEWRWRVAVIQNGNVVETSLEWTFWLDPGFGGGGGGNGGGGDDDNGGGDQEPTPKPTPKP